MSPPAELLWRAGCVDLSVACLACCKSSCTVGSSYALGLPGWGTSAGCCRRCLEGTRCLEALAAVTAVATMQRFSSHLPRSLSLVGDTRMRLRAVGEVGLLLELGLFLGGLSEAGFDLAPGLFLTVPTEVALGLGTGSCCVDAAAAALDSGTGRLWRAGGAAALDMTTGACLPAVAAVLTMGTVPCLSEPSDAVLGMMTGRLWRGAEGALPLGTGFCLAVQDSDWCAIDDDCAEAAAAMDM